MFAVLLVAGHRSKRAVTEPSAAVPSALARVLREWALQDFVLLAYLVVMLLAVFHGGGARRPTALAFALADVVVFTTRVVAARRSWLATH